MPVIPIARRLMGSNHNYILQFFSYFFKKEKKTSGIIKY
jgi:hypothetical protein